MDAASRETARRRTVLLLVSVTTCFLAVLAVQARADSPTASTVTLCANPAGQVTLAPEGECPSNTVGIEVASTAGLGQATAELEAADAAFDERLTVLEQAVEILQESNEALTHEVDMLRASNNDLILEVEELKGHNGELGDRVSVLEAWRTTLEPQLATAVAQLDDLTPRVEALEGAPEPVDLSAEVAALQATLANVSRDGSTLLFEGLNLQVVNGNDRTDGDPNGYGNIIIGYDAERAGGTSVKSGSHYLVIGDGHSYTRFGGIVAGLNNTASGDWASVTGGAGNEASGTASTVTGGRDNTASGARASVSGGRGNSAEGSEASVSGGDSNAARRGASSVSGGQNNLAEGIASSVSGGEGNRVLDAFAASVSGGALNTIEDGGSYSSILGGFEVSLGGTYNTRPQ